MMFLMLQPPNSVHFQSTSDFAIIFLSVETPWELERCSWPVGPRRAQQRVFSSREASAMHMARTEAEVQEAVRQAEQAR